MASHTDIIRKFDNIIQSMFAGGVNNPIDYIEQISYFLFLKLLDEKEEQTEQIAKLTGKAYNGVFSGDQEKYRFRNWAHSLNGDELRLFIESDIFPFIRNLKSLRPEEREYFRNAHLKIYEPSTLKGVVESIASMDFSSLDTIDKGDLYEHMLSQISKSGKLGQFRTPRHIIDMMTQMVDPDIMETIYDPSVGTAGFIISAFQHILKKYSDPATMKHKVDDRGEAYTLGTGDKLSDTQRDFLYQKTFYGYDIDANMVRFSIMNMILHGFTEGTNIRIKDTLGKNSDEQEKSKQYNIILANPPFSGTIDRSRIDPDDFPVASNSTEVLFLGHMIDKLRDGGRAAVIVPEGVIFKTNKDYIGIRKYLMTKCKLQAVISLPSGVFNPYSGVNTKIFVFQKGGSTDKVWFYDMHADGYDLGAQRRPIKETDIPDILHHWEHIKKGEYLESDRSWFANIEEIEKNEWVLSAGTYKPKTIQRNDVFPYVKLGDVCEINPKKSEIKGKIKDNDAVGFLGMADISESGRIISMKEKKLAEVSTGFTYFADGDILFAKITPCMENGKGAVVSGMPNKVGFGSTEFHVLRCGPNVLSGYVFQILQSKKLREEAEKNMTGSAGQKRVPTSFLENYEIPLPPLDVQQELVNKLNAQQAIIDSIDTLITQLEEAGIDESLFDGIDEWVELGEVCENLDSKRKPVNKGDRANVQGEYPYYGACGIVDYVDNYIFDGDFLLVGEDGENLRSRNKPLAFSVKGKIWVNNHAHILQFKDLLSQKFVEGYINAKGFPGIIRGAAQPKLTKSDLMKYKVPNPTNERKKEIVESMRLIQSNLLHLSELRLQKKKDIEAVLCKIFN